MNLTSCSYRQSPFGYRQVPIMVVMAELVRNAVTEHSDNTALIDLATGSDPLTFAEVDSRMDRLANGLRELGLEPGDHLSLFQRNSSDWIVCEGAAAKAGLVTVPINVYLSPDEVRWILDHSESRGVIFSMDLLDVMARVHSDADECGLFVCISDGTEECPEWAVDFEDLLDGSGAHDPYIEVGGGDPHRIMYTSGTTGRPKGVLCPNEVIVDSVLSALANQVSEISDESRFLAATPLTHVANGFFWPFFTRGASSVIMRRFDPAEFCKAIVDYNITHTVLAPTMIIMVLRHLGEHPESVTTLRGSSLEAIWYAGSPIPPSVAEEAEEALGPILNQQYGLTELFGSHPAMGVTQLSAQFHRQKPGSCGRPIPGSVVRVLGEDGQRLPAGELGEVAVKSHARPGRYWRLPDDERGAYRNGWIYTGDIGEFDEDGFLYLKDRKNDMIISGGLNIYPSEVENVIATHPDVEQVSVVGIEHPKWVEVPCAVVVAKQGQDVREDAIIEFTRDRIANYKAPKKVVFVDELPVSSTGKVLRREIRDQIEQMAGDWPSDR